MALKKLGHSKIGKGGAKNSSAGPGFFGMVFAGVLGGMAAMALIGLICISLFALGFYLIKAYNKPGTKTFEQLQPMQIVGIVLCILACLPFIQYFFMGLLSSAGGAAFDSLTE
jgi:predicted lipid-binding transport protein (Tim44 family)